MPAGGQHGAIAPDAAGKRRRRVITLILVDGVFFFFVLLPGLIYLLMLDNGMSERAMTLYVGALLACQAVVTGILIWTFRIVPGPRDRTRG